MITKVLFGDPFPTEAVIKPVEQVQKLKHFSVGVDYALVFTCPLDADEVVYGLGETTGKMNKRGGRYISFNTDTADHSDSNPSLYASHNLLVLEKRSFCIFFDTPGRVDFLIDWNGSGKIEVICPRDVTVYQVEADTTYEAIREFLEAVGPSYLPPRWAFGYGQSRFGYKCEQDFLDVLEGHRKAGLPLDYICMDIDYMDGYRDFTVDTVKFPDLKAFSERMLREGIHLVPIVDAGIKVDPGEPVYEDAVKEGVFCTNKEGKLFQGGVWPGMTHFPDFLNPKARQWFGQKYQFYTDRGIEGFWNDMNEPALFYTEYTKGPKKLGLVLDFLFPRIRKKVKEKNLIRDYQSFFHHVDGKQVCHYDVHNIYGSNMIRSTSEGLFKLLDHRYLVFGRSSYIGAGRYGGVWTGDNTSCWEHIMLNMRHVASLNMCGFLYSGADTGGFMGNCTRELLLRWLAVSVFTPLMRNHSSMGTRAQEAYRFGDTEDFRSIISLRYRLLPYIYSEYMKAALGSDLYIKPLTFEFPQDDRVKKIEDQLLVGDSIMIAPIVTQGATVRSVYLPEQMTMVCYDGKEFACTPYPMGEHQIEVPLNCVVFFIRNGKLLPVGKAVTNSRDVTVEDLQLLGNGETYDLYWDDGMTRNCTTDNIRILKK